MTPTQLAETVKRNTRTAQYDTFDGALARSLAEHLATLKNMTWPAVGYQKDPVGFARDILGIKLIHKVRAKGTITIDGLTIQDGEIVIVDYQAKILEAIRDNRKVAVTSGHKIGKSLIIAIAAIWFYCCFPDARVLLTSSSYAQVENILWREIRRVLAQAGRCVDCKAADPSGHKIPAPCPHSAIIPEEPAYLPAKGLRAPDFREIFGFSSKEPERVAGISGANILYLPDEASGVPDRIFEAIDGNRAGGARIAMFSNPTRNEGRLWEAFYKQKDQWRTFRISSLQTVNCIAGEVLIGGLAERSWVDEMLAMYGAKSAQYKVRVLGEHTLSEENRPFDHHTIATAQMNNEHNEPSGRLSIGIDPAGDGERADDTAFAWRRGLKALGLDDSHSGDLESIALRAQTIANEWHWDQNPGKGAEIPIVIYDAEGPIGYRLGPVLQKHSVIRGRRVFEVFGVKASDGAARLPQVYERQSAELVANLEQYLKQDGGGLITNDKLEAECYAWEYEITLKGKRRVDKRKVKQALKRSPDRFDAVALSVWEPVMLEASHQPRAPAQHPLERTAATGQLVDPFAYDMGDDLQSGNSAGVISPWG